jgi:putative spermidine/putrescine transport system permease protein
MVRGTTFAERLQRSGFRLSVGVAFGLVLAPLFLVLWLSFFDNEILALPPQGYSLRWYRAIANQPQFISGLTLSFVVAIWATAMALAVSIPAALALTRARFRGREAVLQLLMSPLIVPAIVIGSALYMGFVEAEVQTGVPLSGSTLGFAMGHMLIVIPWCLRLVAANLVGVNPFVEEAALSLGATPFETIRIVTLPLIWPGIVAAALFSFVVSFGNVELSLFLVAPGQTTLPIAILQYLQWKIDPTVAAMSTLQIVVVTAALLITDRFVSLAKAV